MVKLAALASLVVGLWFAPAANAWLQDGGHWPRPSLTREVSIRIVDATGDPGVHGALTTAAAEWSAWSPDLELFVETGDCSQVWGVITPGLICIANGNLFGSYWGYTLYSSAQSPDGTYLQYLGVQITVDLAVLPGAGDPALVWILAHELGHAVGLGHNDLPSIMWPVWSGQCCPTGQDLIDLHSLYQYADQPCVRKGKRCHYGVRT